MDLTPEGATPSPLFRSFSTTRLRDKREGEGGPEEAAPAPAGRASAGPEVLLHRDHWRAQRRALMRATDWAVERQLSDDESE